MGLAWLLLLISWPLLEIAVLIKAGAALGFLLTLAIVIATGVLGTAVLMRYGLDSTFKVQEAMARGEPPLAPMMDGALIATAGVLLITPGLCADAVGLLLLIPPLRAFLARQLLLRMLGISDLDGKGPRPTPEVWPDETRTGAGPGQRRASGAGPVIEGEFERLDERTVDPKRGRPDRE